MSQLQRPANTHGHNSAGRQSPHRLLSQLQGPRNPLAKVLLGGTPAGARQATKAAGQRSSARTSARSYASSATTSCSMASYVRLAYDSTPRNLAMSSCA